MSSKSAAKGAERRRHARFAVVEGIVEPIEVDFGTGDSGPKKQPAIMTDLSAGGMSLLLFLEPPQGKTFDMNLSLPGLKNIDVTGKVVRVHAKGQTFSLGISFTKISKKHQDHIDAMANDHMDCDTRIALKLPEVCVKTCQFHALCAKTQKAPYWTK
jgi:hypothetical protein